MEISMTTRAAASGQASVEGTARTRDGTELSYRLVRGAGKGRCALVHSLAMDKSFWDGVVTELGGADVLVFDCRGHGRSGKPAGPYSVALFADDLADLLDAVGWRSAIVAGASMGGCVSLAFAAGYGDRVDGLGLFDTTAWYGENAPKAWEERAERALNNGMASLVDFQTTRWFGEAFRKAHARTVEKAVDVFVANDVAAYAEACRMLGAADIRAALGRFDFPCRVLVGSEDYATPEAMARFLADGIPGARLTVLEGARHCTPLERPDAIAAELKALIAEAGE
jgi:3-oxoadipate enol-lactonase